MEINQNQQGLNAKGPATGKKHILTWRIFRKKNILRENAHGLPFEATAMGDLASLLLIFFIVTSSFFMRQGIFLSLPAESAGTVKIEPELIVNIFPNEKDYKVESNILTEKNLLEFLKKKKQKKPETIVIVYMHPKIKYYRLVDTLSIVRESGINQISLKNW